MMVLLAANNLRSVALPCLELHGMIETSEPVSIRNCRPDTLSVITRRWLVWWLLMLWQSRTDVSVAA